MPANKYAMTRYRFLDELLGDRYHSYSLDDLTEEVNRRLDKNGYAPVVRRTIEKDIDYLENNSELFGVVEIERYSAPGYDYKRQRSCTKRCLKYADPTFSIFKKELSDEEDYLLSETLSILGQFEGLPNLEALERLRVGRGAKRNEGQIISFAKNPLDSSSSIFGELFTAISQKQVIELHYRSFSARDEFVINLYPYLLKEYNHRWYVIAGGEKDGKIFNFALDRIEKIVSISHKYVEFDGDINELFEDIIGVTMSDTPIYQIIFWVANGSKNYVLTKPLHESQRQFMNEDELEMRSRYPQLEGGLFFQIECKDNYELIRELSSFGKDLLVLSPKPIQDEVVKRFRDMQSEYSKIL
ncbi:MAG: WYL domain-containing protein [Bacteroidales bacterium]|nr:WYL domain-containing protein [Bacteroidales bacterium]